MPPSGGSTVRPLQLGWGTGVSTNIRHPTPGVTGPEVKPDRSTVSQALVSVEARTDHPATVTGIAKDRGMLRPKDGCRLLIAVPFMAGSLFVKGCKTEKADLW